MNNELTINKILDYCDEPQLFIARDMFDAQYICLLYADEETPKYTAVKISNAKKGYTLDAETQESITVHLPIKDHGLFTELVRKFGWACM